jgi:hypothetical protein
MLFKKMVFDVLVSFFFVCLSPSAFPSFPQAVSPSTSICLELPHSIDTLDRSLYL